MVYSDKIFSVLNIPNKALKNDKGSKLILHSISQERSATQKDLVISQLQKRCSRDSISFLRKVHCGESIILILNIFSFVKTMLFKTLYWNSLIFVSSDTLNESKYISFQSNWKLILKPLLSTWRSLFRHCECIVKRF